MVVVMWYMWVTPLLAPPFDVLAGVDWLLVHPHHPQGEAVNVEDETEKKTPPLQIDPPTGQIFYLFSEIESTMLPMIVSVASS